MIITVSTNIKSYNDDRYDTYIRNQKSYTVTSSYKIAAITYIDIHLMVCNIIYGFRNNTWSYKNGY